LTGRKETTCAYDNVLPLYDFVSANDYLRIEDDKISTVYNFGSDVMRFREIAPSPFFINFCHGEKSVAITLKNGEDIFKLADAYERFLIGLGVEYDVERIDASAEAA